MIFASPSNTVFTKLITLLSKTHGIQIVSLLVSKYFWSPTTCNDAVSLFVMEVYYHEVIEYTCGEYRPEYKHDRGYRVCIHCIQPPPCYQHYLHGCWPPGAWYHSPAPSHTDNTSPCSILLLLSRCQTSRSTTLTSTSGEQRSAGWLSTSEM